jgi:hypothetical protein
MESADYTLLFRHYKVALLDDEAGHYLGWNPDNAVTGFGILGPAVSTSDTTLVSMAVDTSFSFSPYNCEITDYAPESFRTGCETAPAEGATLDYIVTNLPAHVAS